MQNSLRKKSYALKPILLGLIIAFLILLVVAICKTIFYMHKGDASDAALFDGRLPPQDCTEFNMPCPGNGAFNQELM